MRRLIALVALGGCSFATMQSPHGSPPECEESQAAPIVDIALTVASPFLIYWAARSSGSSPADQTDAATQDLAAALITAMLATPAMGIFGASAVYGFVKSGRCTRAKRDYAQLMAAPPTPGGYVPPPVMPGPGGAPPPQAPLPMVPPGPAPAPMPAPPPAQ